MTKPTKTILIVDDDADTRNSIRLALEEQDHMHVEITGCHNVDSAVKQIETETPDIIILDLHMPGKSGFDFMNIINANDRFKDIKVIMLTVDDTMLNIFDAESKGINAYYFLGKPFNITDLQALILNLSLPMSKH